MNFLKTFVTALNIEDYKYELPADRIAAFPLAERDQSKLLVYKDGGIRHERFDEVIRFLPEQAILFFNDTKVIPARIHFTKETAPQDTSAPAQTGAVIEIFLLNSLRPPLVQDAMQASGSVEWQCTIGNLKRWKDGILLKKTSSLGVLSAALVDRDKGIVRFTWMPAELSFAEILQGSGTTPLPPYIKREANAGDQTRYQTVYSEAEGAVAAPTAGLHFTRGILTELEQKGIVTDFLTLHVSAGTFQPVKVSNVFDHTMHTEQVIITRKNIGHLLLRDKKIVAVGTTSLRTLESIYWFGAALLKDPAAVFEISKLDPYNSGPEPSPEEAFDAVAKHMDDRGIDSLTGETSILILPGYRFKSVDVLITNFHQPGSTLMLLVAAFVGDDWRKIYQEALSNSYRFLSYGDSSVLYSSPLAPFSSPPAPLHKDGEGGPGL